jgi:hypothetical protein
MQSTQLTYDQIRDQTRNLCIEGQILSRIGAKGERRYSLAMSQRSTSRRTSA